MRRAAHRERNTSLALFPIFLRTPPSHEREWPVFPPPLSISQAIFAVNCPQSWPIKQRSTKCVMRPMKPCANDILGVPPPTVAGRYETRFAICDSFAGNNGKRTRLCLIRTRSADELTPRAGRWILLLQTTFLARVNASRAAVYAFTSSRRKLSDWRFVFVRRSFTDACLFILSCFDNYGFDNPTNLDNSFSRLGGNIDPCSGVLNESSHNYATCNYVLRIRYADPRFVTSRLEEAQVQRFLPLPGRAQFFVYFWAV